MSSIRVSCHNGHGMSRLYPTHRLEGVPSLIDRAFCKSEWAPGKFEGVLTRIFWPKLGDLMYSCLNFGKSEGVPCYGPGCTSHR